MSNGKCIYAANKIWNSLRDDKRVIGAVPLNTNVTIDNEQTIGAVKYCHISQSVNGVTGWSKAIWFTYSLVVIPPPPPVQAPIHYMQFYQMGDDFQILGKPRDCSYYSSCPGVMVLLDEPDTFFTFDWQMYLVAINKGMRLNNIAEMMGNNTEFMNGTGVGNNRRNYITGEDLDAPLDPRLKKLLTCALNTHMGWDDGTNMYLSYLDGNNPPPMKSGRPRPRNVNEVIPEDYLYLPQTHKWLFIDCNTVKWDNANQRLDYGTAPNGLIRDWLGDNTPHIFFPLVSTKSQIVTPLSKWNKISFRSVFRH